MKWKKRMKAWINCSLISIPFHYHFVLIKTKKRAFITFFVLIITKCTTLRTESMKMKERINTKKRNGCVINSFTSFFILSPSPGCVEWIVNEVERSMRSLCSLIFFVLLHLHFIPKPLCSWCCFPSFVIINHALSSFVCINLTKEGNKPWTPPSSTVVSLFTHC